MPFTSRPTTAPAKLWSLMELARKADISYPTAQKLAANGIIKPDAYNGRMLLFDASRWPELRKAIKDNVIDYSTRDAAAFIINPQHPLNGRAIDPVTDFH